jgi:hypothetical protein
MIASATQKPAAIGRTRLAIPAWDVSEKLANQIGQHNEQVDALVQRDA